MIFSYMLFLFLFFFCILYKVNKLWFFFISSVYVQYFFLLFQFLKQRNTYIYTHHQTQRGRIHIISVDNSQSSSSKIYTNFVSKHFIFKLFCNYHNVLTVNFFLCHYLKKNSHKHLTKLHIWFTIIWLDFKPWAHYWVKSTGTPFVIPTHLY